MLCCICSASCWHRAVSSCVEKAFGLVILAGAMSASSSPGNSPVRPSSKSQLPASIASASLEELQKLFVDSLKKLKARDKRIADLTASQEALQGRLAQQTPLEDLEQQLQADSERAEAAERRADDAQAQFEGMYKACSVQTQQLEDAANEKTHQAEQMASVKEVLRSLALEKDAAQKVRTARHWTSRLSCYTMQKAVSSRHGSASVLEWCISRVVPLQQRDRLPVQCHLVCTGKS